MLNENIKQIRKSKGLSQEELAIQCNVVRQTVSKWEHGLSVPDADLLIAVSHALETPVSTLLGETVTAEKADDLKAIAGKLEVINYQLAKQQSTVRNVFHWIFLCLSLCIVLAAAVLLALGSPYLRWDTSDTELAVIATACHALEWVYFRAAPFALVATVTGAILTRKKR